MQYIYVLDYSTPSRITIKVPNDIDIEENIDAILNANHLRASECSWMVSDKPLDDEIITGVITKILINIHNLQHHYLKVHHHSC